MTNSCASIDAVVEETASGGRLGPDMAAHLDGCAACQARLALARRIDRVLADWPVAVPPPHFAAQVASRVRQDAWRHEVVVDWGFNIALAASLVFIVAGAGSFLWLLGAVADPAEVSRLAAGQLESARRAPARPGAGRRNGDGAAGHDGGRVVVGRGTPPLVTCAPWRRRRRRNRF